MMFRARSLSDSRWIYGMPYQTQLGNWLIRDNKRAHAIDPSTIGQGIGIKDRDGRDIYEGDIISIGRCSVLFEIRYNPRLVRYQAYALDSPVTREIKAFNSKSYQVTSGSHENGQ